MPCPELLAGSIALEADRAGRGEAGLEARGDVLEVIGIRDDRITAPSTR